jgi:hypothetical protein
MPEDPAIETTLSGLKPPTLAPPNLAETEAARTGRLTTELNTAKRRITELERSLAEANAAKSAAEAMLDATSAECDRLRSLTTDGDDAVSALADQAHDLEKGVDELVEELAARDVSIAELARDTDELRRELQTRGDEIVAARSADTQTQQLYQDSQERVELLESRLAQALTQLNSAPQPTTAAPSSPDPDAERQLDEMTRRQTDLLGINRQLEADLAEAIRVQQELLRRSAARGVDIAKSPDSAAHREQIAKFEQEVTFARNLIENLESECQNKESKLAGLQSELLALRNIIKHVDGGAIEAARRRLSKLQ